MSPLGFLSRRKKILECAHYKCEKILGPRLEALINNVLIEAEIWRQRTRITSPKTSASDREKGYLAVCRLAVSNDGIFKGFKKNWHYRRVLEHVSEEQGRAYLKVIKEEDEELLKYVSRFRENDLLGSPITFDYDIGRFSPTTLRYMKVLADLKNIFGDLSNLKICEIGAGYGGQSKIISDVFNVASYTIIDLETVIPLIRKYLETLRVRNVVYLTQDQIAESLEFDLVVSNYAFSECIRHVQEYYLQKILDQARRGYLTYNFDGVANETSPYNKEEIVERLSRRHVVQILGEKPKTGPKNFILVWNDKNPATSANP